MLSFILDPNEDKRRIIQNKAKELNMEYINLVDLTDGSKKAKELYLPNTKPFASVEDFMNYFMNASFIITDSFHGTCFSVIYNKEFISIANYERGERRVIELLEWIGIKNRILFDVTEDLAEFQMGEINYETVNSIISQARDYGKNWLMSYLKELKA